jgi:hypothetical protein
LLIQINFLQVFGCPDEQKISWKPAKEFLGNGKVLLENHSFEIDYNCMQGNLAMFCQENENQNFPIESCTKNVCIPKCCPVDQLFNVDHMHCDETTPAYVYKPEIFSSQNQTVMNISLPFEHLTLKEMQLKLCPRDHDFFFPPTKVRFLSDGNLFVDDGEMMTVYNQHFCIDNFYIQSEKEPFVSAFVCNNISPLHTLNHSTQNTSKKRVYHKGCSVALTDLHSFDQSIRLVYSICGLISEIFILITLIVYLAIPKLRNCQGKIVMANLFSIFITTGLLVNGILN